MTRESLRGALADLACRVGETDGRMRDVYLGAHLAVNLLSNHDDLAGHDEFVTLLDSVIGKEFGEWQAFTN